MKLTKAVLDNAVVMLTAGAMAGGQLRQAVEQRDARIAELEAAIDKLAQCKGRFHTEANFKALIEVRNKSLHK